MSNKIAILAHVSNSVYAFQKRNDLTPKDFTAKYHWVQSIDDARGRIFSGYIKLWSWEDIDGIAAIMYHFSRHDIQEVPE